MKCAASLSTDSSGVAVRCLLFRQRTQASVARAVVIQRKKTACHKASSGPGVWIYSERRGKRRP